MVEETTAVAAAVSTSYSAQVRLPSPPAGHAPSGYPNGTKLSVTVRSGLCQIFLVTSFNAP